MSIVSVLTRALKDKLTPSDQTELAAGFAALENASKATTTTRATQVMVGSLSLSTMSGIEITNPETGTRAVVMEPSGDVKIGSNVDSPGYTSMSIFSNDGAYNSEVFGSGDLLLGDNSSGQGNLLWDKSAGKLYIRSGTTPSVEIGSGGIIVSWAEIGGWTVNSTSITSPAGSIVLDSTNNRILAGTGINLNGPQQSIYVGASAGITLHGPTESIIVGAASPQLVINGSTKTFYSSNYSNGAAGFIIQAADGDAEFNNIVARGTFRTSVFQYESLSAIAGHLHISKSAAEVYEDVTTAATFTLKLKNADGGGVLINLNDILEIKSWNGTELIDVYVTAGAVTDAGTYCYFTATLQSGGTGKSIQKGMAVVNLGPSGSGAILLQAGDPQTPDTPTRMSIRTHAGSPWTAWTNRVVIGDMYNTYDVSTNHYWGLGIGDYAGGSGNFLTYNHDNSNTFRIQAGDGGVTLSNLGLRFVTPTTEAYKSGMEWYSGGSSTLSMVSWLDSGITSRTKLKVPAVAGMDTDVLIEVKAPTTKMSNLTLSAQSGIATGPSIQLYADDDGAGAKSQVSISSELSTISSKLHIYGNGIYVGGLTYSKDVPGGTIILESTASGYGFVSASTNGLYLAHNQYYDGSTWRTWSAGTSDHVAVGIGAGRAFDVYSDTTSRAADAATSSVNTLRVATSGALTSIHGAYFGTLGGSVAAGEVIGTAGFKSGGAMRTEGSGLPTGYTGAGVETAWLGSYGRVIAYNRTSSAYQPLYLTGSLIYLQEGTSTNLQVYNGDVYSSVWQGWEGSSTITGWTSFTAKEIFIKQIGKTVICSFYIDGTSNSTSTQFTLPFTSVNATNHYTQNAIRIRNNSTWAFGVASVAPNSNVVICYPDAAASSWSSSNIKTIVGEIVFQATAIV